MKRITFLLLTAVMVSGNVATAADDSLAVPAVIESKWLQHEQELYTTLLTKERYDVLVVPFQVSNHGFDTVSRSLMTRFLVDRIERTTDQRLPNPTLVERSLGKYARTFDPSAVYQLANALEVHTIIWGYTGHDNQRTAHVRLEIQKGGRGQLDENTPKTDKTWPSIAFSDRDLPSERYRALLPEIAQMLALPEVTEATELSAPFQVDMRPSLVDLLDDPPDSALEQAFYLQLLGLLNLYDREQEHLFERSLVALEHVNTKSPDWALLKARAYFYLHRRPAAMQSLGVPKTPAEKALHAYLQGNLPELKGFVEQITSPVAKFMAELELVALQTAYGDPNAEATRTKIETRYTEWTFYMKTRHHPAEIVQRLDDHFPVPGRQASALIGGKIALKELPSDTELVSTIVAHAREFLGQASPSSCCDSNTWQLNIIDHLDIVLVATEEAIFHRVNHALSMQALPERALELLQEIEPVYEGHPIFTRYKSSALFSLAQIKDGIEQKNLLTQAYDLQNQTFFWSEGQCFASVERGHLATKVKGILS